MARTDTLLSRGGAKDAWIEISHEFAGAKLGGDFNNRVIPWAALKSAWSTMTDHYVFNCRIAGKSGRVGLDEHYFSLYGSHSVLEALEQWQELVSSKEGEMIEAKNKRKVEEEERIGGLEALAAAEAAAGVGKKRSRQSLSEIVTEGLRTAQEHKMDEARLAREADERRHASTITAVKEIIIDLTSDGGFFERMVTKVSEHQKEQHAFMLKMMSMMKNQETKDQ
jgi:hypothetical protein